VEVGSFSAVRHAACYFTQSDTYQCDQQFTEHLCLHNVCKDMKNNAYRHTPQVPGNPGDYKFCTVVFHICGSSVSNFLYVNLLAPRTL